MAKKDRLDVQASKKKDNKKKNKPKKEISKRRKIIKRIIIGVILVLIIIGLVNFFIAMHRFKVMAKEMLQNTPSTVLDKEGNEIAKIGAERNRENISLSQMPDNLKNAYVAIEDERFYKHGGIDIKRTAAATWNYITSFGNASFGGSTITQQLVKNLTRKYGFYNFKKV